MKRSMIALVLGAAMAVASMSAIAEAAGNETNWNNAKIKTTTTKKAKLAAVSVKKVTRKRRSVKRRSVKLSGKRSVRRSKYLPMARRMKPAGLPISLVDAVITMESGYNPAARGGHGEVGLMQVKPATARMVRSLTGVKVGKLSTPANNLRVGMAYLNWCYKRAKRNIAATIGCYNAGPGNMWKWQKFAVTRKYVRFVRQRVASN